MQIYANDQVATDLYKSIYSDPARCVWIELNWKPIECD